jgi:hypothetical protein
VGTDSSVSHTPHHADAALRRSWRMTKAEIISKTLEDCRYPPEFDLMHSAGDERPTSG